MKTRKYILVSTILLILGLSGLMPETIFAQDIRKPQKISMQETSSNFRLKYGMGLSTRYLWRGLDLAQAPTLEPYGIAQLQNFELSLYGIYGLYENTAKHRDFEVDNPTGYAKLDPFYSDQITFTEVISNILYNIHTKFGTFRLGLTDYYFPDKLVKKTSSYTDSSGIVHSSQNYRKSKWLDWDGNGEGAHVLEANILFTGHEKFPFWALLAVNVHNDPDNALYLEAGYIFDLLNSKLSIWGGGTVGPSRWYQFSEVNGVLSKGNALTNFGVAFSREIALESWLVINFSLQDVIDFYDERNTVLFSTILKIE